MLKANWISDKPLDMNDYSEHWRKKTKGFYCLGLGRWFRVCKQNIGKDPENSSKLF